LILSSLPLAVTVNPGKEEISLPRYPDISPDGSMIVFRYQGDIWTVSSEGGEARRITCHRADDTRPVFSPNGRWIAFSSNRCGNYDVFIIPVRGGVPRQLTFCSLDDYVTHWTPDSRQVVFQSSRFPHFYYGNSGIYTIPAGGGMPAPLVDHLSRNGKMSGDGKMLAFNINWTYEFLKGYRGAADNDVWVYRFDTKTYSRLTQHPGNDKWPVFGGKRIYYVTDKDGTGTFNVWCMNPDGSDKERVTGHKGGQVRFPAVSRGGKTLVYEYLDKLYRKDEGKPPRPIKIYAPPDYKSTPRHLKNYTSNAAEMTLSPDGNYIAFIIRGELFVVKKDWRQAKNLTRTAAREGDISWSPDGKEILFYSDRNGNRDLFVISANSTPGDDFYHAFSYKTTQLTHSPEDERMAAFSPDGKKIAYLEGKGKLVIRERGTNKKYTALTSRNIGERPHWSPDSRYIAYSWFDNNNNQDVYIYWLEKDRRFNISKHPDSDFMPRWSPDGRFLYILSQRKSHNISLWRVALQKKWFDMTESDWKKLEEKEEETVSQPLPLNIEFKDIHRRMVYLANLLANVTSPVEDREVLDVAVSPDSKTLVFSARYDIDLGLYAMGWNGREKTLLVKSVKNPGYFCFPDRGDDLYYIGSGNIFTVKPGQPVPGKVPFSAKMEIRRFEENGQKFHEAWRAMKEYFYESRPKGVDWNDLYEKYRPWAVRVVTDDDFDYVFNLMVGELKASHQYIVPPKAKREHDVQTGFIGVIFDHTYAGGGFKIKQVLDRSPASRTQSRLLPGDIIVGVNRRPVKQNSNFYRMMENTVGEMVPLQVGRGGKTLEFEIVPSGSGSLSEMVYHTWCRKKREIVDKGSAGQIAYTHIKEMRWDNFEAFGAELYSRAHGKKGLIIDVRYNGGGWVSDYLLPVLMTKQHAVVIPRDGGKGYPQDRRPYFSWTGPVALLTNQQTASNGEVFSWAFRTLKRGPIVGKQTMGAVISIITYNLIDGTQVNLPWRGWYVNDGTMTDMDTRGCPPDYPLENWPGKENAGRDRQLEKAIEVLQQEIALREK
jgi:tricorn protease